MKLVSKIKRFFSQPPAPNPVCSCGTEIVDAIDRQVYSDCRSCAECYKAKRMLIDQLRFDKEDRLLKRQEVIDSLIDRIPELISLLEPVK